MFAGSDCADLCPANEDKLKKEFFSRVANIASESRGLRKIIRSLLAIAVSWQEIVRWGVQAGKEKPVRKLVSEILLELGIRRRKAGAGKHVPQQALVILAFAREQFGEKLAPKFLRAAARAAGARLKPGTLELEESLIPNGISPSPTDATN